MSTKQIPIIDLFAGPGGLGEGFTSVVDNNKNRVFKIALSIERDEFAHKTLTLRSFLRQFPYKKLPKEYYQFVRREIKDVDTLYMLYPKESENAHKEAWKFELGNPSTHELLDGRINESLKGQKDFLLIGGPPCQAYSLVGRARRREGNGLNKEDERVYLYREYYRILAVHQPAVFIMENVKGLLSSKVENELIFTQLLNDLKKPVESYRKLYGKEKLPLSLHGYKIYSLVKKPYDKDLFETGVEPKDFIIRAEEYGIPQTRHRVILLGIRDDLNVTPETLSPHRGRIPVQQVLFGLPAIRSGLSKMIDGKNEWKNTLQRIQSCNLEREIDKDVWEEMKRTVQRLKLSRKDKGGVYLPWDTRVRYRPEWYLDKDMLGVANHESRSHIKEDLYRYLFVSCFGKVRKRSPKLSEFPDSLLPKHKNAGEDKFADRFRAQLSGEPSKTITSHISKDGHYFIHFDASQCRSLTVREAARIQTFPDNYFFCGPRTQQFHQVGNAVPPYLAFQIANLVKQIMQQIPTS